MHMNGPSTLLLSLFSHLAPLSHPHKRPSVRKPALEYPILAKSIPPSLMFVVVPWRRGNVSIQILPIVRTRDMFDSYQTNLPQTNRALAFI